MNHSSNIAAPGFNHTRFTGQYDQQQHLKMFADTPDEWLRAIAQNEAVQNYNNSGFRKVEQHTANIVPVADSFVKGALKSGSFTDKLGTGLVEGAVWAIVLGAQKVFNKLFGKLEDTQAVQDFRNDHPVGYEVGKTGAMFAFFLTAYHYVRQFMFTKAPDLINKLKDKLKPETLQAFSTRVDKLKTAINKSVVAEKLTKYVLNPVAKFARHPVAGLATLLILGGILVKAVADRIKMASNYKNNYDELQYRRETAQMLVQGGNPFEL